MTMAAVVEFSRPLAVATVQSSPVDVRLEANAAEREALARRFGILSMERLEARLTVGRGAGAIYRVEGEFDAEVTQTCIVTLEPVRNRIVERIDASFATASSAVDAGTVDLAMDEEDPPDPIVDGRIDLGEAVAQALALVLDPYPRRPGATFEMRAPAAEESAHPFAALAQLRRKPGTDA
jgi:uncharacterized metal-binding protein YceD (DUF177 family)